MEKYLPQLKNKNSSTKEAPDRRGDPPLKHQSRVFQDARCHRYRMLNNIERNGSYRVKYPHFFMLFILEGHIAMQTDTEEQLDIKAGECLCTYHNEGDYKLRVYPGNVEAVTLVFQPQILVHKEHNQLLFPSIYPVIEAMIKNLHGIKSLPAVRIRARTKKTIETLFHLNIDDKNKLNNKINHLILQLVSQHHEDLSNLLSSPALSAPILMKIYIDENLDNPNLQVKQLTDQFIGSARTLQRKFQEAYGSTIKSYITAKRMEKALQLLKEKVSVNDVLPQVGYVDQHSFSVQFKKYYGFPPSGV
ncbi:helix-turn-helix transcriptional regulator [Olivibacter domesticus]|uniref:AraC-type DNA-binding protein n=1 Tax=Olivibacter domesticus TaxID=407022 RepID=A0A1H7GS55_OLID1|nr:AraC family transcriptional regulator [Olivibacter domesticus]SEK40317.1 AraC-type DNA-binding protein [Olivibacter domesticus]